MSVGWRRGADCVPLVVPTTVRVPQEDLERGCAARTPCTASYHPEVGPLPRPVSRSQMRKSHHRESIATE